MAELDPLGATLLVIVVLVLATAALFVLLRLMKSGTLQRALRAREEETAQRDRAHNALVTSEGIARELAARGLGSAQASALLQEAWQAHYEGHPGEADSLAAEARSLLLEVLQRDEVPDAGPEEVEALPEEKPVLGKEYPKNYLQAKFLLGVLRDRLKGAKKGSPEAKRARQLARDARTTFDEERYTDAVALALNARRALDGEAEDEVGPETPRREADGCPSCGTPVGLDDTFCGRCGTPLEADERACPGCKTGVAPDDNFCRKCGAVLEAKAEAR